jgi:hypothetical protein
VKKYFLPLVCFLFTACDSGNEQQQPPAGLIPKEKMVSLLIDIHIAESKIMQRNMPGDSAQVLFQDYKAEILKKMKVDKEVFRKSYEYYMVNISDMDAIYAIVVDSLSLRESTGKLSY